MLEADTVNTHAKNVRPKSEDVSERARRVVRRNDCGRRETSRTILLSIYGGEFGERTIYLGDVIRTTTP